MLNNLIEKVSFMLNEMELKRVQVKTPNEEENHIAKSNIFAAMKICNIEYSEWVLDEDVVLITKNFLNHAGISYSGNFLFSDFITLPFDLENQYKLLDALYKVYKGDASMSEVHVAGYSHVDRTKGFLKISFIKQTDDLGKSCISFVTQSIRHLSDSVEMLTDKNNLSSQILQNINMPIAYCSLDNGLEQCNAEISALLRINAFEIKSMTLSQFLELTCKRLGNAKLVLLENDNRKSSYQLDGFIEDEKVIYTIDLIKIKNNHDEVIGDLIMFSDQTYYNNRISRMKKLIEVNELLSSLDNLIIKEKELDELYNYAMQGLKFIISSADRVSILLKGDDNNLRIRSGTGYSQEYIKSCCVPYDESIAGQAIKDNDRNTIYVKDVEELYCKCLFRNQVLQEPIKIESSIISPFMLGGRIIGFLNVESENRNAFDTTDVNIVEFARNRLEQVIERHEKVSSYINTSVIDELTGIHNRRYFTASCDELLLKSEEYQDLTLVIFDLDNLKKINDQFGHHIGDQYIIHFAKTLNNSRRKDDIFARIGGDEFAGLYINESKSAVERKMIELQEFFMLNPITVENIEITVSFSYGVSSIKNNLRDLSEAMKVADERMYEDKNSKKGLH